MSDLLSALPENVSGDDNFSDESARLRSNTQIERDQKIGAAGELFVSLYPVMLSLVNVRTDVINFRSSSF